MTTLEESYKAIEKEVKDWLNQMAKEKQLYSVSIKMGVDRDTLTRFRQGYPLRTSTLLIILKYMDRKVYRE